MLRWTIGTVIGESLLWDKSNSAIRWTIGTVSCCNTGTIALKWYALHLWLLLPLLLLLLSSYCHYMAGTATTWLPLPLHGCHCHCCYSRATAMHYMAGTATTWLPLPLPGCHYQYLTVIATTWLSQSQPGCYHHYTDATIDCYRFTCHYCLPPPL